MFCLSFTSNTAFSTDECGLTKTPSLFQTGCNQNNKPICCANNFEPLTCKSNASSCKGGPASNNACVMSGLTNSANFNNGQGCDLNTQYCCKDNGASFQEEKCLDFGEQCGNSGYTVVQNPDGVRLDVIAYP